MWFIKVSLPIFGGFLEERLPCCGVSSVWQVWFPDFTVPPHLSAMKKLHKTGMVDRHRDTQTNRQTVANFKQGGLSQEIPNEGFDVEI